MECQQCFMEKSDCKDVDIRNSPHDDWRHEGNVCAECRKNMRGLWRYHKKE